MHYRIRRDDVFFGRVLRHGGLGAHGLVRLVAKRDGAGIRTGACMRTSRPRTGARPAATA